MAARRLLTNHFFCVRHGESTANAAGIISSTIESAGQHGLTATGIKQAEKAASQLHARLGAESKGALIITSDFARAQQTASVIAEQLGAAAPVDDVRLRERFFGIFEGGSNAAYERVWAKDSKNAAQTEDGVESVESVAKRVASLVRDLEQQHHDRNIILVAHGDTLGILVASSLGIPLRHHRRIALENAEVREFALQLAEQNQRIPPASIRAGPMPIFAYLLGWFSTPGTLPSHHRLISIGISHYCEKARWALDLAGCPYTEDMHPPGLHMFATIPATGANASMTPVLVGPDNNSVMWDSTRIIEQLAEEFPTRFPANFCTHETHGWEEYFDQSLGPNVRRWVYSQIIDNQAFCVPLMTRSTSRIERLLLPLLFARVATGMRRSMVMTDEAVAASQAEIRKVFDRVSRHLIAGHTHLCGSTFSAADLTFAALGYPVLYPPCTTSLVGVAVDSFPLSVQQLAAELRATPAGQFALRIYEQHRPTSDGLIALHLQPRDRVPPLLVVAVFSAAAAAAAALAWTLSS